MRRLVTAIVFQALVTASAMLAAPAALAQTSATAAPSPAPSVAKPDATSAWKTQLQAWRSEREHELTAPDGWLTLVALDWLKPGVNTVGSAPDNQVKIAGAPPHVGIFTVAGNTVQLLAPREGFPAGLKLDGQPAREGNLSADDHHPSTLTWNSVTMIVLPRGDRYALRVKDANSPHRTGFKGLHWYEPNLHYTVEAKWTPAKPPRTLKIPTVIGTTLSLPSPGTAEFTLDGKKMRLDPVLEAPGDNSLFFILRDATSKTTTYQAGRFLRTSFPDHGLDKPGTLIIDFNQLYNPPCAYTPYATCPLPPDENRLPIAIQAGEQRYTP